MTVIPRGSQSARMPSRSAGTPAWSTRMTARVRAVRCGSHCRRRQVLRRRVDVGENGPRADIADRVGGGDERQRRDDDLVAGADPRCHEGQVQAAVQEETRDGVAGADRCGESLLELGDPRPLRHPPGGDAAAAAAASSAPSQGRITGIITGAPLRSTAAARARHHDTSRSRPSSRPTSAFQPRRVVGERDVGQPAGYRVHAARRPELQRQVAAHHPHQRLGELGQAGLGSAADVEHLVGRVSLRRRAGWRARCPR